jgi:quercetin dioxygenase-like cupin family protein
MIDGVADEGLSTEPIEIAVLRADEDGESYFDNEIVSLAPAVYVPGIPLVDVAEPVPATAFTLSRCEAHYVSDWHPAPRRQFVIVLAGGFEVTPSVGESRRFEAGDVFRVEDLSGRGHQTIALGDEPCVFATVACADRS